MAKTIVHDELENAKWGGEEHLKVSEARSFAQMIYELLSEKTPNGFELNTFELILNLSIDHGPNAPSAKATIEASKEGKSISESVARGIEQINESHGGAIEPAMELLYKIKNDKLDIKEVVEKYLSEGKRMPGFGHRIYTVDPRAQLIFGILRGENHTEFIEIAKRIEEELKSQKGKVLPVNIDGAIAVTLCSFGWEARLANAVFIIARTPGLCAHYINNS